MKPGLIVSQFCVPVFVWKAYELAASVLDFELKNWLIVWIQSSVCLKIKWSLSSQYMNVGTTTWCIYFECSFTVRFSWVALFETMWKNEISAGLSNDVLSISPGCRFNFMKNLEDWLIVLCIFVGWVVQIVSIVGISAILASFGRYCK